MQRNVVISTIPNFYEVCRRKTFMDENIFPSVSKNVNRANKKDTQNYFRIEDYDKREDLHLPQNIKNFNILIMLIEANIETYQVWEMLKEMFENKFNSLIDEVEAKVKPLSSLKNLKKWLM